MIDIVYAMGTGGEASGQGGGFGAFVPLILMFVIFYFLLIRPQQKKQKQHRQMISELKKGDRVIFASYAGTEVEVDGEEFLIMSEEDVLAVVKTK